MLSPTKQLEITMFSKTHFRFNPFSWLLISAYILACYVMEYFSPRILWEGIILSAPLIMAIVYWSENTAHLIREDTTSLLKEQIFYRDLFLLTYSYLIGFLFSLLFQYNNSDARGWWTLAIWVMSCYAIVFASLFSLIALIIPTPHQRYSFIFSIIVFLALLLSKFWPYTLQVYYFGDVDAFLVINLSILSFHFLLCLIYWCSRFTKSAFILTCRNPLK